MTPRTISSHRNLQRSIGTLFGIALLTFGLFMSTFSGVLAQPANDESIAQPEAPGSISGRVTDGAGRPLEGVNVGLIANDSSSPEEWAFTDTNGNYQFPYLGTGLYRLSFYLSELGPYVLQYYPGVNTLTDAERIYISENHVTDINAVMVAGGAIKGTINVDESLVLVDANLSVWQNVGTEEAPLLQNVQTKRHTGPSAISNTLTYTISGLQTGSYRVCARTYISGFYHSPDSCYGATNGVVETATDITVTVGTTVSGTDIILPGLLAGLGSISGTVTSKTGQPVPDINVSAYMTTTDGWIRANREKLTDERGNYHFETLEPGQYTLYFFDAKRQFVSELLGYASSAVVNDPRLMDTAETFDLGAEEVRPNIDFILREGATISGTVNLDGAPNLGIFEVSTEVFRNGNWLGEDRVMGNADGSFTVTALTTGRYRLSVDTYVGNQFFTSYYGGDSPEAATVLEIDRLDAVEVIHIDIQTNIFDGELGGVVTAYGQPLENILVAIDRKADGQHRPTIELMTDSQGRYHVGGVLAGSYCIRYSDPNGIYATDLYGLFRPGLACDRLTLEEGQAMTSLDIGLVEDSTLSGIVTYVGSEAAADVLVEAYVYSTQREQWVRTALQTRTDANGHYSLTGLLPRNYRIGFRESGDESIVQFYGSNFAHPRGTDVAVAFDSILNNINFVMGAESQPSSYLFLPLYLGTN